MMSKYNVRPTTVALVIVLSAPWTPRVRAREQGPLPALVEVAAFGCADCSGPQQFTRIVQVDAAPGGTVYVLDQSAPFVRVFSMQEDELPTAFVRQGQGPGEVEAPRLVAGNANGSFSVLDWYGSRFTLFASDGSVILDEPTDLGRILAADYDPVQHMLSVVVGQYLSRSDSLALRRVDTRSGVVSRGESRLDLSALGPRLSFLSFARAQDGSLFVGTGEDYEILVLDEKGVVIDTVDRVVEPPLKSREELAREQRAAQRMKASRGVAIDVNDHHRHFYFDAFDVDSAGNLWVSTARRVDGGSIFDVFDDGVHYLGSVQVDRAVKQACTCFAVADDMLAAAVTDEHGYDMLVVWAMEQGPSGSH